MGDQNGLLLLARCSIRRRLGGSTYHPASAAYHGIVPRGAPWPSPGNQGGWEGKRGHRGRGVGSEKWAWHDPGGRGSGWACRSVGRAGADCATRAGRTGGGGAKVVVVTSNGSDLHVAQLAPNGPSFGPRTRSVLGGVFWGGVASWDRATLRAAESLQIARASGRLGGTLGQDEARQSNGDSQIFPHPHLLRERRKPCGDADDWREAGEGL